MTIGIATAAGFRRIGIAAQAGGGLVAARSDFSLPESFAEPGGQEGIRGEAGDLVVVGVDHFLDHVDRQTARAVLGAAEGPVLDLFGELPRLAILHDSELAVVDRDFQRAGREGADEDRLPGVLRERDIDEAASTHQARAALLNLEVALPVGLRQSEEGDIQAAAVFGPPDAGTDRCTRPQLEGGPTRDALALVHRCRRNGILRNFPPLISSGRIRDTRRDRRRLAAAGAALGTAWPVHPSAKSAFSC